LFSIKYLHHIVAFRDEKCIKTHLRAFVLQKNFSGSLATRHRRGGGGGGEGRGGEGRGGRRKCQNTPLKISGYAYDVASIQISFWACIAIIGYSTFSLAFQNPSGSVEIASALLYL
jgi:hypothetical protein